MAPDFYIVSFLGFFTGSAAFAGFARKIQQSEAALVPNPPCHIAYTVVGISTSNLTHDWLGL